MPVVSLLQQPFRKEEILPITLFNDEIYDTVAGMDDTDAEYDSGDDGPCTSDDEELFDDQKHIELAQQLRLKVDAESLRNGSLKRAADASLPYGRVAKRKLAHGTDQDGVAVSAASGAAAAMNGVTNTTATEEPSPTAAAEAKRAPSPALMHRPMRLDVRGTQWIQAFAILDRSLPYPCLMC